jgi:hypothetical protein
MGDSPSANRCHYDLLTLKLMHPKREDTHVKKRRVPAGEHISKDTYRLPRHADNGLPELVKYSFIHSLRQILFSFIYLSQNIYLHKKMWKYVFLGDIKLYI